MSTVILFLGGTGGTVNACLTHALSSGDYHIIALARTPQKLMTQLTAQQRIDEDVIRRKLTIVQGDATKPEDIQRALLARITTKHDTALPFMIISGIGGLPVIRFSPTRPLQFIDIDNPTICESAARALVNALQYIQTTQPALAFPKPHVAFISTTGISRGPEDVPSWMRFLYHQLLALPHEDKKKMEDMFRGEQASRVFQTVTGIRPTLLMGTGNVEESVEGANWIKIRAGKESNPCMGYTIKRADVGQWMFENIVKDSQGIWRGEMCSLAM